MCLTPLSTNWNLVTNCLLILRFYWLVNSHHQFFLYNVRKNLAVDRTWYIIILLRIWITVLVFYGRQEVLQKNNFPVFFVFFFHYNQYCPVYRTCTGLLFIKLNFLLRFIWKVPHPHAGTNYWMRSWARTDPSRYLYIILYHICKVASFIVILMALPPKRSTQYKSIDQLILTQLN